MIAKILILASIVIGIGILSESAYAQDLEFGVRQVPSKIIENTQSKLEIFTIKEGILFPQPINQFTITSQDPDIVDIVSADQKHGFNSIVEIDAKKQGTAKLSLAGNGYKSTEFSVTVHQNQRNEKNIILKAIPDSFSANGPRTGFISVELLDEDGNPIVANEDIPVHFSTSNDNFINLKHDDFTIKKGSYYKVQKFEIKSYDTPITVFAKTANMPVAEKTIEIDAPEKPYSLNLYVSPDKTSSKSKGGAYAIVQLQDDDDEPIVATKDIAIGFHVESPFASGSVLNENGFIPQISLEEPLIIKEGSYWAASKINTDAAIKGDYILSLSSPGFKVGESKILKIVNIEKTDDANLEFDSVPILTIGGEHAIGVAHLNDDQLEILIAENNLNFRILSSDEDVVNPKASTIPKLNSAALIMADIGYYEAENLEFHESFGNSQFESPEIFGPTEESIKLRAEPLIDKIMANSVFPVVVYAVDNDGNTWYFPESEDVFVSPSEFVSHNSEFVHQGDGPVLLEMFSIKDGEETLLVQSGMISDKMNVQTHQVLSSKLLMDIPDRIFSGVNTQIIFQLLDSRDNPIFAHDDIVIDAISDNESIVHFDDVIKIKRGNSFSIVEIESKNLGAVEVSLLSKGFPLEKQQLMIDKFEPVVTFDAPSIVNASQIFDATILVTFDDKPLGDVPVSWNVLNGVVQGEDSKTGPDGKAKIVLLAIEKNIQINAQVTSEFLPSSSAMHNISVRDNEEPEIEESLENIAQALILGVVAAVVGGAYILKKKNLILRN